MKYSEKNKSIDKYPEKEMAIHSWRISWAEEPGGLQFMGSQRAGHDWETTISFKTGFHTDMIEMLGYES